jgi:hypothetical protein
MRVVSASPLIDLARVSLLELLRGPVLGRRMKATDRPLRRFVRWDELGFIPSGASRRVFAVSSCFFVFVLLLRP